MEKRFIIGFSGRIGSGKDTAALIAKNAYPHLNFVHVAFADALKEAYTTLTGRKFLSTREFKESICPVFHVPVRDALQRIGTNALRNNFDKDIWIKILQSRYPTQNLIISDVRFLNEAAWVRKNGGTVIQIERTDQMAASIWANHESEAGVQGDFVIENDFSENGFLNFKERVERILELITGEQIAKADKLPKFTSLLDAIQYWMKEFDVLKDGKGKARDIYYKLVVEELNEAMWEEPGSQRQAEELCDLIWVTIALALCSLSPEQIQTYMKRLFTANMSKATSRLDLVQAFCYEKENLGKYDIMKSASGRYYVVDKETHKIQKGPAYEKFNLDGLF